MKRWIIAICGLLVVVSLACSTVGQFVAPKLETALALTQTPTSELQAATEIPATPPATDTPTPTFTPAPPTPTFTATIFPTATGPRPSPSPLHYQVFDQLWQTINENYLYRDFNGLDWNAVREEMLQKIGAGMTDDEFYAAMFEIVHRLGDEHSTYFSPERARQLDTEFAGDFEYVGIGVYHIPVTDQKKFTIVLVFPGSPAEEAGLKPHDSILAVDGQPVFDEQGNRLNVLRGPPGSTVTLTVQTPGEAPREVQVTRREVSSEMPIPHQVVTTPAGKRIGYLLIPTFNEENIDQRIGQAIQDLADQGALDGLIVDNRHNGGGRDQVMLNTLAYFTNGDVGYFVQRDGEQMIKVNGVNVAGSQSLPLAVLVGEGTASFGEVFSGVLQNLGRATIIGKPTMGNVELLRVYDFLDASRAWIATGTFRPLNGVVENWEKSGILPDISVNSQWDETTFENDPAIQEALRFLGG